MILAELLEFMKRRISPDETVSVGHTMQLSGYQTVHICVHVSSDAGRRIDRSVYVTSFEDDGVTAMEKAVAAIERGEWDRHAADEPAAEPQEVGL